MLKNMNMFNGFLAVKRKFSGDMEVNYHSDPLEKPDDVVKYAQDLKENFTGILNGTVKTEDIYKFDIWLEFNGSDVQEVILRSTDTGEAKVVLTRNGKEILTMTIEEYIDSNNKPDLKATTSIRNVYNKSDTDLLLAILSGFAYGYHKSWWKPVRTIFRNRRALFDLESESEDN